MTGELPKSAAIGVGAGAPASGAFTGTAMPEVTVVAVVSVVAAVATGVVTATAAGAAAVTAVADSAAFALRMNCMLIHASEVAGTLTL